MLVSSAAALAACAAVASAQCYLDPATSWGDVVLSDIHNVGAAAVVHARGVHLNSLTLRRDSYITLIGGIFAAPVDHQLAIQDSDHVAIFSTTHHGALRNAISCSATSHFKISYNTIDHGGNDGIVVGGCAYGVIGYNSVSGTVPADALNHLDGIQFWALVGSTTHDILVINNKIEGDTMGIGGHHSPPGAINRYDAITLFGNQLHISKSNAMEWNNCFRCVATANVATTIPGGTTISGNPATPVAMRFTGGSWTFSGNTVDGVLTGTVKAP